METRNTESKKAPVNIHARCFHSSKPLSRAQITIIESGATHFTDEDGKLNLEWEANQPITMVLQKEEYRVVKSPTIIVPPEGLTSALNNVFFQVPTQTIITLFSWTMWQSENENRCQIAGTITAYGKTIDDLPHGEPGVKVELWEKNGKMVNTKPFYFGIIDSGVLKFIFENKTYPVNLDLTETTRDGGWIFTNMLPGEYIIKAKKEGHTFPEFHVIAKPGDFINVAPPLIMASKKTEEKPPKSTYWSFFKPVVTISAGVAGLATYGLGPAVACVAAAYLTTETAEKLSDRCKQRR